MVQLILKNIFYVINHTSNTRHISKKKITCMTYMPCMVQLILKNAMQAVERGA
jgi:hypothetical protein